MRKAIPEYSRLYQHIRRLSTRPAMLRNMNKAQLISWVNWWVTMPRKKKPRGRPPKYVRPDVIPDTPKNITRSLLRTRPKVERKRLAKQGDKAATAA